MRAPALRARSIAATSVVCAILTTVDSPRAFAQNAAAEALFGDGERMLKEGKVAEACDAFEASNRIETRAGTLVNLGLCREQNGQLAAAWSAFKDALARAKDPKKKQIAADQIAAIEPKLSYLTISVADESRVDGLVVTRNGQPVDSALWNRAVPIDGGTYVIAGRAPGHEEWSTTVEVPREQGKTSVEVPRFKELAKLIAPPPTSPVVNQEQNDAATSPSTSIFTARRKLALGVAGAGLAALALGVVLGLQVNGFEDDAYALCPDPSSPCSDGDRANDLISKGRSRVMLANIAYGVGVASLIGAGVVWYLGAPPSPEARVAVMPRGIAGFDLTVRF